MQFKENNLDVGLKSYMLISIITIFFALLLAVVLRGIYSNADYRMYNILLKISIIILAALCLFFTISLLFMLCVYNCKAINRTLLKPIKLCLEIFMPLIIYLSIFLKYNKDAVRLFYIHVNNIIVRSCILKYRSRDVLLLLPHCIQYANCKYRITNDIGNCRGCGKCRIKDIVELREETGVMVCVVTGGTAALKSVSKLNPKLILAVACERDLVGGIIEVRGIPVIGVLNERPYGPCINTSLDINMLREELSGHIIKDEDCVELIDNI